VVVSTLSVKTLSNILFPKKYGKFDWLRNYQLLERGPTDWSYLSSKCLAYAWALQYRKKRMKAGESSKANMLNGTCRSRAKQMSVLSC